MDVIINYIKRKIEYKKRMKKYGGRYNVASTGNDMYQYTDYIKSCGIPIENVVEIGANFAQDAEVLMREFSLKEDAVYVFEAHPQLCDAIKKYIILRHIITLYIMLKKKWNLILLISHLQIQVYPH